MPHNPDRILTLSNALSFYRLCAAPVLAWVALDGARTLFIVLVCISVATDLVDGVLARWLRQETTIGPRLDSLADTATMLAGMVGLFALEATGMRQNLPWLALFLGCLTLASVISLVRFARLPAFHLFSFKVADGILMAGFLFIILFGFNDWVFRGAMILAALAALEIAAVALALDRFRTDQKGIYWVLRDRVGN